MGHAQVEKDETFLMGRGDRGVLAYASGLYRATADLDLGGLHAEFMATDRVLTVKCDVSLLVGDEEDYRYNRMEAYFQEWLLEQGHVERVACKLLVFTAEIVPKPDGSGPERVVYTSLEDPIPESTDSYSPSPG